ncbi:exosortase/archaeosortase family protein [Cognatitamlana onchidii]|uniref:exosortase/archaeosortase family protein n=1 Tax=Cognatitamlana onchidii TaxID=2562860 RepID=UPI0010A63EF4
MIKTKILFNGLKNRLPPRTRSFLLKGTGLVILWKILPKIFTIDLSFLHFPLTKHVANLSVFTLNYFTPLSGYSTSRDILSSNFILSRIYHHDKFLLNVADGCNGLNLFALYIGFILLMPSKFGRKIKYILIGVIIIDLMNILRSSILIYLYEYHNVFFDFAHLYFFRALLYSSVFLLWVYFTKKINAKNK